MAALHTLALLAGLQRAHDGEERKAAFLSVHSEEALRESTYQAASTVSLSRQVFGAMDLGSEPTRPLIRPLTRPQAPTRPITKPLTRPLPGPY